MKGQLDSSQELSCHVPGHTLPPDPWLKLEPLQATHVTHDQRPGRRYLLPSIFPEGH